MEFSAQQIADLLGGEIVGNPEVTVNGLSKIEEGKKGTLSFLANPKYEEHIYSTEATIVIVNDDFSPSAVISSDCTLIKVKEAYSSFAKLLEMYDAAVSKKPAIEEPSYIAEDAEIGADCYVGAFAYIGKGSRIGNSVHIYPQSYVGDNVVIGDNTRIYAGAKVYRDCLVGNDCTIHAGAIIGADGFGFAPNSENNYNKVPQIGNVILEDHVEIGANTCVDRATLGSTVVKKGVKLDNLVQIGHNVIVGDNTVMAAQVGIAGSTKLGKNMMLGGQVGIIGHAEFADGIKIGAQSGVASGVSKEDAILLGSPAIDHEEQKKMWMASRRLPQILERLKKLEEELKELKNKSESNG
jgi:UDP-3-O-[3-hydroxymyristoyl] glucosamine N-acyltransferase